MGIGEYDRNAIIVPVPVQAEVAEYDPDNPPPISYAQLEHDTKLIKNHHRVGVLKANGKYSEIVLHEREAFIQSIMDKDAYNGLPNPSKIVNCSYGWQHSLIVTV